MNNKKAKKRWEKIQENKKKTCLNCSQLIKSKSGDYLCGFAKNKKEFESSGAYIIVTQEYAKQVHACFDKYNGKNL